MSPSSPVSSPVSSPSNDSTTATRRKRLRGDEAAGGQDTAADHAEARDAKRRLVDAPARGVTTRAQSAAPKSLEVAPETLEAADKAVDEPASKHKTSPSDVAEVEELRRPRVVRTRCPVLPTLADHKEEEEAAAAAAARPVTRASSKKEEEARKKKGKDESVATARGILRSTRRRGRAAAAVNRELFRLPTLADLTRVTRSSSRKKPPLPVSRGWDSGEETEREDHAPEASTPEPAAGAYEVRVEAVIDAVFECSEACLCGGDGAKDESGDERCAAYSPLPYPGFSPPVCTDGDELACGWAFEAA